MHNIILIGTYHQNKGACNSDTLHKIIEGINPDVIFLEMEPSVFDDYFFEKSKSRLESDAIIKYMESHIIKCVPVDYDENELFNKIVNENGIAHNYVERRSRTYRFLCDRNSEAISFYGFRYLNSIECENLHKTLDKETVEALEEFKNVKNVARNERFIEIMTHKRERIMLENIDKYCTEHDFETGLFFIGAAHRYTIIEKINELEKTNGYIKWNYRNYDGFF